MQVRHVEYYIRKDIKVIPVRVLLGYFGRLKAYFYIGSGAIEAHWITGGFAYYVLSNSAHYHKTLLQFN